MLLFDCKTIKNLNYEWYWSQMYLCSAFQQYTFFQSIFFIENHNVNVYILISYSYI